MSQQAVERLIGRLITDDQFRQLASKSLSAACFELGLELTQREMELLSRIQFHHFTELCRCIDPGLCRAGIRSDN